MKKGFGIFFIIIGVLNLILGLAGLSSKYAEQASSKIMFGIASLALGIWLVNSSNNEDNNLPTK